MQTSLPGTIRHDAPGKLVHDLHLAIANEVVLVEFEQVQRRQPLAHQLLAALGTGPDPAQFLRHASDTGV